MIEPSSSQWRGQPVNQSGCYDAGMRVRFDLLTLGCAAVGVALLAAGAALAPDHPPRSSAAAPAVAAPAPPAAAPPEAPLPAALLSPAKAAALTGTPQRLLQDYGMVLLEVALVSAGLFRHGLFGRLRDLRALRTPGSIWQVFFVGVAAALVSNLALAASLVIATARNEGALWADPQSNPITDSRRALIFLLVVAAFYSALGARGYQAHTNLRAGFARATWPQGFWFVAFGLPLAAALAGAAIACVSGYFLLLPPCLAWAAFFGLLFASKRRHLLKRTRRMPDLR